MEMAVKRQSAIGGVMAQFLAYARCVRSHGVSDFPDPSSSGGVGITLHGGPGSDLNPNNPTFELTTRDVLAAASVIGIKVQTLKAATDREIDAAFVSLVKERTGALLVGNDLFFNSRIYREIFRNRFACIILSSGVHKSRELVEPRKEAYDSTGLRANH